MPNKITLSEEQMVIVRQKLEEGVSPKIIAPMIGVSANTLYHQIYKKNLVPKGEMRKFVKRAIKSVDDSFVDYSGLPDNVLFNFAEYLIF